jgi:O-antigen ligase
MTLSDRTRLWTDLMNIAKKNPVQGVGFGAFWVGPIGEEMYPLPSWSEKTPEWRPEQGHNGYLDTYVELGAVGVIILLLIIFVGFTGALSDLDRNFAFGSLRISFLLCVLINNMAETSMLKGTHDLWFLFLLMVINIPRPRESVSKRLSNANGFATAKAS